MLVILTRCFSIVVSFRNLVFTVVYYVPNCSVKDMLDAFHNMLSVIQQLNCSIWKSFEILCLRSQLERGRSGWDLFKELKLDNNYSEWVLILIKKTILYNSKRSLNVNWMFKKQKVLKQIINLVLDKIVNCAILKVK